MNWDDLRFVLAVGRGGTLAAASQSLGVHYTSVARRVKQFEDSLGTQLFDHYPRKLVLTSAGEELMRVAERMENEVFAVDRGLMGKDARLSGPLRIASTDTIAMIHSQDFAEFAELHPAVSLELTSGIGLQNLSKREADVALRSTKKPPEHLVGRQVATLRFAPFAMPSLIERVGAETPMDAWPWVHWIDQVRRAEWTSWLDHVAAGSGNVILVDNGAVFTKMVESGCCAGFLPSATGASNPALQRIGPWRPELDIPLWILTHPDLRQTARIRSFMSFMGPRMKTAHQVTEAELDVAWMRSRRGHSKAR
jgi:DNA-binding transcriptional LysR family regulator